MATSSMIQINISLYYVPRTISTENKNIFLELFGFNFLSTKQCDMDELLINSTTRPKPLKKPSGGANLQSSQEIWISGTCETKLGCVLEERENTKTIRLFTLDFYV